jgi:hypothetical protein
MDTTATTMVVTTSPEEAAARERWVCEWALWCATASRLEVPVSAVGGALGQLAADDPALKQCIADAVEVLDALGVDVPPPPPGVCSGCGKPRGLTSMASGMPRCQGCTRRQAKADAAAVR